MIPELSICSPEKNDLSFALIILNTYRTQHLHDTIKSKPETTNITSITLAWHKYMKG